MPSPAHSGALALLLEMPTTHEGSARSEERHQKAKKGIGRMGSQEHGRIDCDVELPDLTLFYSLRPKAIDTPFVESLTGYVRRLA